MLVAHDHAVQNDPSRVLQDLAEELGRMAARAMLRAPDDPRTAEIILGLVLLLISIVVIAGRHSSLVGSTN